MMPRAKTPEEVRREFIRKIRSISAYWASLPDKTPIEKCDGVAFSILNIFDGTALDLPAMDISLAPHHLDKKRCIRRGEDWYEPGMVINDCLLHELWNEGGEGKCQKQS